MREFYGFFDPWEGDDREYSADEFVTAFRAVGGTGVGDGLTVAPAGGMKVRVAPGLAQIHGYTYGLEDDGGAPKELTLNPSGSADRIDRIILRLDLTASARNITMGVLEGTPAANPVPPALTRTDYVKEISLCQIRVRAASGALAPGDLTDERIDAAVCGMLVPPSLQLSSLDTRYPRTVDGVAVDGAGDAALGAVRHGITQTLSEAQKTRARGNIGAADVGAVLGQYATMPEAGPGNVGKIIQYTGATGTYIQGHIYRCVSVAGSPPTYVWRDEHPVSVCGVPLAEGNVPLTAADIPVSGTDSTPIPEAIQASVGRFDLLLTNNASTPAGTVVSYPSDKYDAVGVMIRSVPGGPSSGLFIIPLGDNANCAIWQSEMSWQRTFTAGATALTCTTGTTYVGPYSSPAPGASGYIAYGDGYAIPYKVFGIKF